MAKNSTFTPYPFDTPQMLPGADNAGVMYKEADFHGSDKNLGQPPESPIRKAKGDLSMSDIANFAPRALTSPGLPYVVRKGGK